MADAQQEYDGGEEAATPDAQDYADHTTAAIAADVTTPVADDDYVEEPIEDYVVKLVVDDENNGATLSPDIIDAYVTDMNGKVVGTNPSLHDKFNSLTTGVYDELSGQGTGSKGLFGWSTLKLVLVGLAILCIIALILGILFFIFGKKFKKNKRSTTTGGATTTAKSVVTKGILTQDPKYQPVPNV